MRRSHSLVEGCTARSAFGPRRRRSPDGFINRRSAAVYSRTRRRSPSPGLRADRHRSAGNAPADVLSITDRTQIDDVPRTGSMTGDAGDTDGYARGVLPSRSSSLRARVPTRGELSARASSAGVSSTARPRSASTDATATTPSHPTSEAERSVAGGIERVWVPSIGGRSGLCRLLRLLRTDATAGVVTRGVARRGIVPGGYRTSVTPLRFVP